MDAYLRDRAEKLGAKVLNGLMMRMEQPGGGRGDPRGVRTGNGL